MNRKAIFFLFVFIVLGMGIFAQEPFTWSLALVKGEQGIPFEDNLPVSMRDGDSISIELSSESDFYVYIVLRQASGALTPLFYRRVNANKIEKIPVGKLSPPRGQERFYVVASYSEQRELRNAIEAYNREKTPANADILTSLLSAIRNSGDDNPGRPTDMGDSIRGETVQGKEYSGATVYAKTITIRH